MKLKQFGMGAYGVDCGDGLNSVISRLTVLIEQESENCEDAAIRGPRMKRLDKAQAALDMLNEIASSEPE